ncbi:MAG: hypothetical protein VKK04_07445 [Synechococcales bacterium]|nr:hypothetical protein [Synechococcales bacterium]
MIQRWLKWIGRSVYQIAGVVGDHQNSMHAIGHDDEIIELYQVEMMGNFLPAISGDLPKFTQPHFVVDDVTEEALAVMGADGDEICA